MKFPEIIENLILFYQKMPGIGRKSAERMALKTLEMDEDEIRFFSQTLLDANQKIKKCSQCNNFSDFDLCSICSDKKRNARKICIVEDARKIITIEKLQIFDGCYYLLEALITPEIENEKIDQIVQPILEKAKNKEIDELIFALRLTIESETTIAYMTKLLEKYGVKITKIAQGVPHGADIDYLDALTIEKAFADRK